MAKLTVSRRKSLLCFWLRLFCFVLLTLTMLFYANYVLTPKHDYGICSMVNLYRQEPDGTGSPWSRCRSHLLHGEPVPSGAGQY